MATDDARTILQGARKTALQMLNARTLLEARSSDLCPEASARRLSSSDSVKYGETLSHAKICAHQFKKAAEAGSTH